MVVRNGLVVQPSEYTLTNTALNYSGVGAWEWLGVLAAVAVLVPALRQSFFSGPASSFTLPVPPSSASEVWPFRNGLLMESAEFSVVDQVVTPTTALADWEWLRVLYNVDS